MAPRTSTEEIVASIWGEVLGLDQVGVHDPVLRPGRALVAGGAGVDPDAEMFAAEIPGP